MNKIYSLRCPVTNEIRYIGKTTNVKSRLRQHNHEARVGVSLNHKCAWIRSLHKNGLSPKIEVELELPDQSDWKKAEVELIASLRAAGVRLTNTTPGGDEPAELSPEGWMALSKMASERFGSEEGRKSQSEKMKALCMSDDWRLARDMAAKATRATPEYKARMSERAKAKWADPAYRERMRKAREEVISRPGYRDKLSKATKRAAADPLVRQRLSEGTRKSWESRRNTACASGSEHGK